jgi:acyl-CoA reductase-like NAD-dependent aldehyde dehydrogenase
VDLRVVFAIVISRFRLRKELIAHSRHPGGEADRTGAVALNATSTWRTDQLAYGGVKDNGIGREGPRYAIGEMTEERLAIFNM